MQDFGIPEPVNPFAFGSRFTICTECGNPVTVAVAGGAFECGSCKAAGEIGPRDTRPVHVIAPHEAVPEPERIRRLGIQDGHPWLPPPALQGLVEGGAIPDWKMQEASIVWRQTLKEVRATGSHDAAERLLFLTLVLGNAISRSDSRPGSGGLPGKVDFLLFRAMHEAAFDALVLPRHRQFLAAQLSRLAARHSDLKSAEAWLALCDPASDDIDSDSGYRAARAFIDTASCRYGQVLDTLGRDASSVPIADTLDSMCSLLRANALEKTGDVEAAIQDLVLAMKRGRQAQEGMARMKEKYVEWRLCDRSFREASDRVASVAADRAAAMSGGGIARVFTLVGVMEAIGGTVLAVLSVLHYLGVVSVFEGPARDPGAFAPAAGGAFMLLMGIGFAFAGRRAAGKAAAARELRLHGIAAKARVVEIAHTGMKINNVPQWKIDIVVMPPGKPQYEASTKMLLSQQSAAQIVPGTVVMVRMDPADPANVLIETT